MFFTKTIRLATRRLRAICPLMAILFAVALFPQPAAAQSELAQPGIDERDLTPAESSERGCSDRVQECFIEAGSARNSCFFRAVSHNNCAADPLRDLVIARWSASTGLEFDPAVAESVANEELENGGAIGFLGGQVAQIVDQQCLDRFDTLLFATVGVTEQIDAQLPILRSTLEQCSSLEQPPLFLP